jgi:hypothetical protein
LGVVGVDAIDIATGEHLIGPEHDHLPLVTEEAEGLLGRPAAEQPLQLPPGAGGHGDVKGLTVT